MSDFWNKAAEFGSKALDKWQEYGEKQTDEYETFSDSSYTHNLTDEQLDRKFRSAMHSKQLGRAKAYYEEMERRHYGR